MPVDDKKPLKVKIQPTYSLDMIQSITLKSFRKVVGYDTFEAIRRNRRSEVKDSSEFYNVTVNFMVRRKTMQSIVNACGGPKHNITDRISPKMDKGFPYDDADRDEALIKSLNHGNSSQGLPTPYTGLGFMLN